MRYTAIALLLLLTACTESSPAAVPTSTTSVPATTTTSAPLTTSSPSPSTTTAAPTTTTPPPEIEEALPVGFTPLPVPDEELPHGLGQVVFGNAGLVYAGAVSPTPRDHPNEGALWHYDGAVWTRTLVADLTSPGEYGSFPDITRLVSFGGRYLAFLQGDTNADQGYASYLASDDGVTWTLERIMPRPIAGGSLIGVYPTPESPPWPGPAGIANAIVTENEVIAVGWVVTSEGSAAVVWRSGDGRSWTLTPLPSEPSDRYWASDIAVGESGWLVSGAGPWHGLSLLWYSPDGRDWTNISDAFGEESWWSFQSLASGRDGLATIASDLSGELSRHLWRSGDGRDWTDLGPVDDEQPMDPRFSLGSDGATITRLRSGIDSIVIDTTTGGEEWTVITSFPHEFAEEWENNPSYEMSADSSHVVRWPSFESGTTQPAIWFNSPAMDVVLVDSDDTLNIRTGVMAEVIGELVPTATGIVTTGRTDGAAGSSWLQILHNGRLGWVSAHHLSEPTDDFDAGDPLATVEDFIENALRTGSAIAPYLGPKGLNVSYWEPMRRWSRDDSPMTDPTIYVWGCPECGPDPGPTHHATFADWIAAGVVEAWDHPDRVIAIGGPAIDEPELQPQHQRSNFANLHYVAVHKPDGDQYQDWKTWYVYLEEAEDRLVVVGISADMWIP